MSEAALGIDQPRFVRKVDFNAVKQVLKVHVNFAPSILFPVAGAPRCLVENAPDQGFLEAINGLPQAANRRARGLTTIKTVIS